jgi:hypothetical protein
MFRLIAGDLDPREFFVSAAATIAPLWSGCSAGVGGRDPVDAARWSAGRVAPLPLQRGDDHPRARRGLYPLSLAARMRAERTWPREHPNSCSSE